MKPHLHARASVRKYGGKPEDYIKIHEEFDSSKIAHASMKHRCIFHSAFGCYLIARIYGDYIVNSDGHQVSVRDIAEDHIMQDLGFIPSLDRWLSAMSMETWMGGPVPSIKKTNIFDKLNKSRKSKLVDDFAGTEKVD